MIDAKFLIIHLCLSRFVSSVPVHNTKAGTFFLPFDHMLLLKNHGRINVFKCFSLKGTQRDVC